MSRFGSYPSDLGRTSEAKRTVRTSRGAGGDVYFGYQTFGDYPGTPVPRSAGCDYSHTSARQIRLACQRWVERPVVHTGDAFAFLPERVQ